MPSITPAWRTAAAAVAGRAAGRARAPPRPPGEKGPLRAGSVGPKSATTGVPTAQARCSGPVSAATTSRARRASSTYSSSVVGKQRMAAPADAATTRSARPSSPGPKVTSDWSPRPRSSRASSPKRSAGQSLLRPAAAGVQEHEARRRAGPAGRRRRAPPLPPRTAAGTRAAPRASMPSGASRARFLSITWPPPTRVTRLAQQPRRARPRAAPRAPSRDARRAREPRPGRRLPEALEVERDVVAARAQRAERRERAAPSRRPRREGAAITWSSSGFCSQQRRATAAPPPSRSPSRRRCSAASAGSVWTTSPIDERRTRSAFTRGSSRAARACRGPWGRRRWRPARRTSAPRRAPGTVSGV